MGIKIGLVNGKFSITISLEDFDKLLQNVYEHGQDKVEKSELEELLEELLK